MKKHGRWMQGEMSQDLYWTCLQNSKRQTIMENHGTGMGSRGHNLSGKHLTGGDPCLAKLTFHWGWMRLCITEVQPQLDIPLRQQWHLQNLWKGLDSNAGWSVAMNAAYSCHLDGSIFKGSVNRTISYHIVKLLDFHHLTYLKCRQKNVQGRTCCGTIQPQQEMDQRA